MAFTTTAKTLAAHFATRCNETPSVRLLTTRVDPEAAKALSKSKQKSIAKGKAADPGASRSRGCAFVEFASAGNLQRALQFHHTLLEGRTINVELTAGGGGQSGARRGKIASKNAQLEKERGKLHEKYVKPAEEKRKEKGREAAEKAAAAEPAAKRVRPDGEGEAQWGRGDASSRGRGGARGGRGGRGGAAAAKVPRWAASGSNAVKLAS